MMPVKFLFVACALIVMIASCAGQYGGIGACAGACTLQVNCPYNKEIIWSTDEAQQCRVFQNPCFLLKENCKRKNECLNVLEASDKPTCMINRNNRICLDENKPICGVFSSDGISADDEIQFQNKCSLEKTSCNNIKPYIGFYEGLCDGRKV